MFTYGFFDSVDGDRVYNADQMSNYFKGLISDGVYQGVGTALEVLPGTGMSVTVGSGRAIVNCKWANNTGTKQLDITPAHGAYSRYTNVVVRLDENNRVIELDTVDGLPSMTPEAPEPVRSGGIYELVLAQILIPPNSSEIYYSNITDTRANSALCGWVVALVQNLDTSMLFNLWEMTYRAQFESFQATFEAWFQTLTDELNIDTYIQEYTKTATNTNEVFLNDIEGYSYEAGDIIHVYVNGLKLNKTQYELFLELTMSGVIPKITIDLNLTNADIEVVILKSVIGMQPIDPEPEPPHPQV